MTILERRFFLNTILPAVFLGLLSIHAVPRKATAAEISGFAPVLIEKISVARQLELLQAICEPGQVELMSTGTPNWPRRPTSKHATRRFSPPCRAVLNKLVLYWTRRF